jgi:hypothetical protein
MNILRIGSLPSIHGDAGSLMHNAVILSQPFSLPHVLWIAFHVSEYTDVDTYSSPVMAADYSTVSIYHNPFNQSFLSSDLSCFHCFCYSKEHPNEQAYTMALQTGYVLWTDSSEWDCWDK